MRTMLILSCFVAFGVSATARADCGPLLHHDQGGDYTNADDRKGLQVVESFHFTKQVETLVRGSTGPLGGDIGYTLEHFPNHHRALAAMAKLGLRDKSAKPHGATYSVDCYFERAIRFKADDATVRMVYGSYLLAGCHLELAFEQLREALRLAPEHATVNYNLGLLYVKKKDYAQALRHAHTAYRLGFPLPGLKNQLVAAGKWQEPPQPDAPPAPNRDSDLR